MFHHRPPIPLHQHPALRDALRQTGVQVSTAFGNTVILRRMFGLKCALLPRLPQTDYNALRSELRAAHGRVLTMLHPEQSDHAPLRASGAFPILSPASVASLDLTKTNLRENLHQKWRNRLNGAEKSAVHVSHSELPADPHHWLLLNEQAQQKTRGYRNWPVSVTLTYATRFPKLTRLFTATLDDIPVAAMLFLRHCRMASYHIGYTSAEGRALSAHNLLLWRAMLWLRDNGHTVLELGTIATDTQPGLARFKLGTGAQARQLGGTWIWPRT